MTAKQRYRTLQSHLRVSVLHHMNLPMVLLRGIGDGLGYVLSPVPKVSESETGELQVSSHDSLNADPSLIRV